MRIDSGLSNLLYNSRHVRTETEIEDAVADAAANSRPRTASNPAVSSTLLSSSLASALWTVEGGRDQAPASEEAASVSSSAEKIEAFYLEYALQSEDVH